MTQCLLGELISSAKVQTENPTVYHTTPIAIFAALRFHLLQGAEWGYWIPGLYPSGTFRTLRGYVGLPTPT